MKICKICDESKDVSQFYKNKANKDGLHSYCKECAKRKSQKYQKENPDKIKEYDKERYKKKQDYYKDKAKRWSKENEEQKKENQLNWQRENKDSIKRYRESRLMHKDHDISEEELNLLYKYCNNSCMYCGMPETEAIEKYGQRLHKDHADNNGSNGIDNCILACKGCNSSKHDKDWEEWFEGTSFYSRDRHELILNWLSFWE